MAKLTPQQFADKLARNLKNSTEDIRRGVENVETSPTLKAAERADKYVQGVQNNVDKWRAGLKRVDLKTWQARTIDKGIPRIAAGIDAAKPKIVAFAEELLPYQDRVLDEIDRMDDTTLEDSISRSATWIRRMSEFRRE